nr:MAG TPA: hypothetical protein [Crassvirales sp.]
MNNRLINRVLVFFLSQIKSVSSRWLVKVGVFFFLECFRELYQV